MRLPCGPLSVAAICLRKYAAISGEKMSPSLASARAARIFAPISSLAFVSLSAELVGLGADPACFFRRSIYLVTRASKSFTTAASTAVAGGAGEALCPSPAAVSTTARQRPRKANPM